MDQAIIAVFSAIGVPTIAGIVWAIRQEGRLNYVEKIGEQRSKHKQAQIDSLTRDLNELHGKYEAMNSRLFDEIRELGLALREIRTILKVREQDKD